MKTAADRREKQREKGLTIHYGRFAWKRPGQAKRDRFDLGRNALAWIGPRWDANRDFGWYDDESGGRHLDHLFCFELMRLQRRLGSNTYREAFN
ncbi:hypothetical protein [Mesorhizobium sp. M0276]|uniref:hypothetical protein n=1 Tax=Mesorhizobium sp. M0276 TaxID=2956928 RepID=UPI003339A75C